MDNVQYLTNGGGDVWARSTPDGPEPLDPASFGWRGATVEVSPEQRRTIDDLRALIDFTVLVGPGDQWVPGPRPKRPASFIDGRAAPAAVESARGTLAYHDRLTDALGSVAREAVSKPERCPFTVSDWVGGRTIAVTYTPPPLSPGGAGRVYVVTDGDGIKIGFTVKTVDSRIAGLRTGKPRSIRPLATVHNVVPAVEAALHTAFGEHHRTGEWFDFDALTSLAEQAGGWTGLLASLLDGDGWTIQVHSDGPRVSA